MPQQSNPDIQLHLFREAAAHLGKPRLELLRQLTAVFAHEREPEPEHGFTLSVIGHRATSNLVSLTLNELRFTGLVENAATCVPVAVAQRVGHVIERELVLDEAHPR
ncbi:MAG: hypothetical protein ACOC1F_13805 [Myxococcota bacterium]